MDSCVLKYIENEKEIAKYKLSMLERREASPARKRIIEIEQEFIQIPFETMSFSSLEEISSAIDLYRQSRRLFYSKYKINNAEQYSNIFSKKISYLTLLSKSLTTDEIKNFSSFEDSDFYKEYLEFLKKEKNLFLDNEISNTKTKKLNQKEPSGFAKKRARLQALFYSMGLVIQEFINSLIQNNSTDFFNMNNKLDSFISEIEKYIYKYYNLAIAELPDKLKDSFGKNPYLQKMHKINNIIEDFNSSHTCVRLFSGDEVSFLKPQILNLYLNKKKLISSNYKKDLEHKSKNRCLGILLPIERIGNEKMSLIYSEVFYSGFDISELFSNVISNVKVIKDNKTIYYKALLLKPLWSLLNYASESKEYYLFLSKLLNEELDNINKFNNKGYIKDINSKKIKSLELDLQTKILIPRTRSEEESFREINFIIFKKISEIKNQYKNIN